MGDWSRPQHKKVMDKVDSQAPNTFKDWINLDKVIIPCLKGTPIVKSWSDANFKISEQEWAQKYSHCEIALRLDDDVDFDDILVLLGRLRDNGWDVIKTENLYKFNGIRGFSLGQGE